MDCGPTAFRMIAKHYGKHYSANTIREIAGYSKEGVSLLGLSETAEKIGFRSRGVKLTIEQLKEAQFPCILHWDQYHFVVLISVSKNKVKIADPEKGLLTYTINEFSRHWISTESQDSGQTGIALLIEPTPSFYEQEGEKEHKLSWKLVLQYLAQSRWQITQVFIALSITS